MENFQAVRQPRVGVGHSWMFKLKCVLGSVRHNIRFYGLLESDRVRFRLERGRLFVEWRKTSSLYKVSL